MLDIEKLVKYFASQNSEKVAAAGRLVNEKFPDAQGEPNDSSPDCLMYFKSKGAIYYARFSNCIIHFCPKRSKVLNPPYWYCPRTTEVDFSKKLRRDHLIYKKEKKDGKTENWQDRANRKTKEKKERVDELLIAARSHKGLSFDIGSSDGSSSNSGRTDSSSLEEPEQQKQPVKIESLEDIRKVNKEQKKRQPKKAKAKKAKPKSKTKGIW
jgi:hypothetical protein